LRLDGLTVRFAPRREHIKIWQVLWRGRDETGAFAACHARTQRHCGRGGARDMTDRAPATRGTGPHHRENHRAVPSSRRIRESSRAAAFVRPLLSYYLLSAFILLSTGGMPLRR
jgi:hypothetical protein